MGSECCGMEYSAGMLSKVFAYVEMRRTIELLNSGLSKEETKAKILNENLYQLRSPDRLKRTVNYIFNRIDSLPDEMIKDFGKFDTDNAKLIVLISIMRTDLLFFEFVYQVFRGKMIVGERTIENRDMNEFFDKKAADSEIVSSWSEAGVQKLKRCYLKNLADAGLMESTRNRRIRAAFVNYRLEDMLKRNDMAAYLNAIRGVG